MSDVERVMKILHKRMSPVGPPSGEWTPLTHTQFRIITHELNRLEEENAELRAHCDRLRSGLMGAKDACSDFEVIAGLDIMLAYTPAKSLSEIKAKAIEEVADWLVKSDKQFYSVVRPETHEAHNGLKDYAQKLREGETE